MSKPGFIDQMTNTLIRPTRDIYPSEDLGPKQFIVKNKQSKAQKQKHQYLEVNRQDCIVQQKGGKLVMSYYSVKQREGQNSIRKTVIYLHANSGSRVQGTQLAKYALPLDWNLTLFDYRGSGNSSGQYTSMGVNQSEDLLQIIHHLHTHQGVVQVALWGRSMGAVTIVYFLLNHYRKIRSRGVMIKDVVLDSPFGDLKRLMQQLGGRSFGLPEFVFNPLVGSINERVISKIGVDLLSELSLLTKLSNLTKTDPELGKLLSEIGGLLLTSKDDKMVSCAHVEDLYRVLPFYNKQLVYYEGDHNDIRCDSIKWQCSHFLCQNRPRINSHRQSAEVHSIGPHKRDKLGKNVQHIIKQEQLNFDQSKHHFLAHPQHHKEQITSPKVQKDAEERNRKLQKKDRKNSLKANLDLREYLSEKKIETEHVKKERPSMQPASPITSYQPIQSPTQFTQPQSFPPCQLSQPPQLQQPTIIINHNYNVSVNVVGSPHSLQPEFIPPINFTNVYNTSQQGYMTDRMPDSNLAGKYFMPYTAKVQKSRDSFNASISTKHLPPKPQNNSNLTSSFSYVSHGDSNARWNSNSSGYLQHPNHAKRASQVVDIPLINFDGISNESHCSSELQASQNGFNSEQETYSSMIIGGNKREKVSLSELRRQQKEEQNNCLMKSSKVLTFKDRPDKTDFYKLDLKKEAKQMQDKWKYRSFEGGEERKMMKTSLMARRKNERKNSDANSSTMKSHILKIQPSDKKLVSIFEMGRTQVMSPKESKKEQF